MNELDGCELAVDERADRCYVVITKDGLTYSVAEPTRTRAMRAVLELMRLSNHDACAVAGSRVYEASILQRIDDADQRDTVRFVAADDAQARSLAKAAFSDRPGFVSGTVKFLLVLGSASTA